MTATKAIPTPTTRAPSCRSGTLRWRTNLNKSWRSLRLIEPDGFRAARGISLGEDVFESSNDICHRSTLMASMRPGRGADGWSVPV